MSSIKLQKYIDKVPSEWGYVDPFWMVLLSLILISVIITSLVIFGNNSIRDFDSGESDKMDTPKCTNNKQIDYVKNKDNCKKNK